MSRTLLLVAALFGVATAAADVDCGGTSCARDEDCCAGVNVLCRKTCNPDGLCEPDPGGM